MASTILRTAVWLTLLGGSLVLYWWQPLVLIGVGVLLAVILIVSKVLGDLFWNAQVRDPTQVPGVTDQRNANDV